MKQQLRISLFLFRGGRIIFDFEYNQTSGFDKHVLKTDIKMMLFAQTCISLHFIIYQRHIT